MLSEFWNHKGWIALVPLALAALAFYAWIAIGAEARTLQSSGIEVQGTIVDKRRVVRPAPTNTGSGTVMRVSSNDYVTVMFTTGSALDDTLAVQQVEHFVDRDFYEAATIGDRITLRYLPDDPERIELVAGGMQSNSNAAGWVALGMVALSALLGWLIWTQAAKVHRFKTLGTPILARIAAVAVQSNWTILTLTLPDGRQVKALPIKPGRADLVEGATITVLSEPGTPGQVMLPPN